MYDAIQNDFENILKTLPKITTKNPEIEIRFGKMKEGEFTSHISKEHFYNVVMEFHKATCLSNRYESLSIDYFIDDCRVSEVSDGKYECMKKTRLINPKNYKNDEDDDSDIRLSISAEVTHDLPQSFNENTKFKLKHRKKKRYTYIYKNVWKYDCTIVKYSDARDELYEIEIELLNPDNTILVYNAAYLAHSLILKVNDIINLMNKTHYD